MSIAGRALYYARSLVTLLTRFERPGQIAAIFIGLPGALPAEVQLRREGWRFQVRQALDVWVIKETCLDGDYVRETALEPDWAVVDIGAGLGDFTLFAAKQCPQGQVHAYEPLAESYQLLVDNLALNGVNNAQAFQEATTAGGRPVSPLAAEGAAVSTRFKAQPGEEGLPAVDLGQVLDRLPGGKCDFLKIDCEGCEFELLLNSPPEVFARIGRLSIETHDGYTEHTATGLARFLEGQGFAICRRPNPAHEYLGFLYATRRDL